MTNKKNFLLMSLEDEKAKKVANILSNKSCSKILEFLTENEATETEIAKQLKLPISTVHYNLKQLLDAKLITWDKFHYSEKGKEVKHYTVANKYIIITPKGEDSSGFLDKLKTIIPTFGFLGLGAYLINWYNNIRYSFSIESDEMLAGAAVQNFVNETPRLMAKAMPTEEIAMDTMANTIYEPMIETIPWYQDIIYQNWFWFLIGAICGISIYLIIKWIRRR